MIEKTGTVENVLSRLQGVKASAGGWQALCPAHEDRKASLSIKQSQNGKILLYCHAGCSVNAITEAIGLELKDLAAPTRLNSPRRIVASYNYVDASGEQLYQVVRYEPKGFNQRRPDGRGGWNWNIKDCKKVLYRLPMVKEAVATHKPVYIVEGEKDVATLEALGLTATCNAGGAGKWLAAYSEDLKGAAVIILPDNDSAGKRHANHIANSLDGVAASIKIVDLQGLRQKGDVSDWIKAGHTTDELSKLVNEAPVWCQNIEQGTDSPFGFPLTDLGNAERLIAAYGSNLHYDVDSGKWLVWNGKYWEQDLTGTVDRYARAVIRGLYSQINDIDDSRDRDKLLCHIQKSESSARLAAMVELAKKCEGVPIRSSDLDRDPWLINCLNCTIDLRSGTYHAHNLEHLITKVLPIDFDAAATCPTWERFLSEIFDNNSELIAFVQRSIGYSLTGDTSEQCFFMLHGNGSNGKSTMLTAIREILADYHRKTGTDTLLERDNNGSSNDIARLRGSRFVSAIEARPGKKLAEALVKEITGGDAISARFLYQEHFEFVPEFKLWLACNHLPLIDGQDNAIWRRIRLIPFRIRFQDADSSIGPYKDMMLPDKLRMEYPGILAWMVIGSLMWQSERLAEPLAIKEATSKYQGDMDVLADFFSAHCVIGQHYRVKSSTLYNAYSEWSTKSRGDKYPMSHRAFSQRLEERGQFQKYNAAGCKWWRGIGIVEDKDDIDPNLITFPIDDEYIEVMQNDSTTPTLSTFDEEQEYEPGCEG